MKTLIVFGSKYGTTETCANKLKNYIGEDCQVINVNNIKDISIDDYENIIIGSPVYAGMFNKEIRVFIEANKNELINKKLGFFMCCMSNGDRINEQFEQNIPKEILDKALAKANFGGTFKFSKMNIFEKTVVKMISKSDKNLDSMDGKSDICKINEEAIRSFVKSMEI